jgi:hypothetical protein
LLIREVHAIEGSENEHNDSAQNSTSALEGGARVMAFTWEDTATYKYVGRRGQFIGNSGPQNETKNVSVDVNAFQMFFTEKLI